ncbi:hypothetical protein L6250_02340 [Candidatus Parcubacteria bacterium]|nr:hypothetical protein [Candidatus Parcubacteria bacterium]
MVLLCAVVVGLSVCGGSLVLGGTEVIDLQLSVLIARLAAVIALAGGIPFAIWVIVGIGQAIGRRVHRLHH